MSHPSTYSSTKLPHRPVDRLKVPAGLVSETLDHREILQGVREFYLNLMRTNQSGAFRRWHSPELARRAYEEHIRLAEQ